jgi:two-component system, OmpR family, sensor histidine kinase BaeS
MPGLRGLSGRITIATLIVALAALSTIAVGILFISANSLTQALMANGMKQTEAEEMYAQSVVNVFGILTVVAVVAALVLGILLARMITRPLSRVGTAARMIAAGDYDFRVPRQGPPEVRSVAESFNLMAQSLSHQEQQRAELVTNFAHELRTPLTNLRGYLEAMRDGVMDPSPWVFESLREEVDRLERLSRSLDALTGQAAMEVEPSRLDLIDAVPAAVELARPAFDRARIRLWVELPPTGPVLVRTVPDHLRQVLANLLQNAQRYTTVGGGVSVAVRVDQGTALVIVTNTGAEVPSGDLPHLFERFYRVDKSRDRARGGAGIGLAIVKQLVEHAGGGVGAESAGGATRVWFRLPLT